MQRHRGREGNDLMPIVIFKHSRGVGRGADIHGVFDGTKKQAEAWCKAKNDAPHNTITEYWPISYKTIRSEGKP